jgi:hypothetical protein
VRPQAAANAIETTSKRGARFTVSTRRCTACSRLRGARGTARNKEASLRAPPVAANNKSRDGQPKSSGTLPVTSPSVSPECPTACRR